MTQPSPQTPPESTTGPTTGRLAEHGATSMPGSARPDKQRGGLPPMIERPPKPCLDCGQPQSLGSRCQRCERRHDEHRILRRNASRGGQPYGPDHVALRRRLAPYVHAGMFDCARCGEQIRAGQAWDLDHVDDAHAVELGRAPAHADCNRQAGGRLGGLASGQA